MEGREGGVGRGEQARGEGVMDKDGEVGRREGVNTTAGGEHPQPTNPPTKKKGRQRGFVAIFTHLLFPPSQHLC